MQDADAALLCTYMVLLRQDWSGTDLFGTQPQPAAQDQLLSALLRLLGPPCKGMLDPGWSGDEANGVRLLVAAIGCLGSEQPAHRLSASDAARALRAVVHIKGR